MTEVNVFFILRGNAGVGYGKGTSFCCCYLYVFSIVNSLPVNHDAGKEA